MAGTEPQMTMDYWKEKCSICFENRCEFCFPGCEDQFCTSCIKRYFKEVVDNSWGLSGCKMKCPVCYATLAKEVWTKYADKKTIQRFEAFNKPFRPFSRFCDNCGEEVCVAKTPVSTVDEEKKLATSVLDSVRILLNGEGDTFTLINEMLEMVMAKKKTTHDLYQFCTSKLDTYCSAVSPTEMRIEKRRKVKEMNNEVMGTILAKVIGFEKEPDKWRQLQHVHIKRFPKIRCEQCTAQMCFQCGESTWHLDETCHENMLKKLVNHHGTDLFETIQWTLTHSKRCPNCSILINREDGCNKVDCLHCGHTFCWICEDVWSSKCGFYKCKAAPTTPESEDEELKKEGSREKLSVVNEASSSPNKRRRASEDPHTELGVPNVVQIERKLSVIMQERTVYRSEPAIPPSSKVPTVSVTVAISAPGDESLQLQVKSSSSPLPSSTSSSSSSSSSSSNATSATNSLVNSPAASPLIRSLTPTILAAATTTAAADLQPSNIISTRNIPAVGNHGDEEDDDDDGAAELNPAIIKSNSVTASLSNNLASATITATQIPLINNNNNTNNINNNGGITMVTVTNGGGGVSSGARKRFVKDWLLTSRKYY